MTIKTPKYVIQQANEKPAFIRQHWLLFSLLGLAVLTFIIGRYSNVDVLNAFQGQKQTWAEVNQELSNDNERLKKQISLLSTEAKIKQQAIIELQKDLSQLAEEKAMLHAEVAFYENLLSHEDGIKKLRVFELIANQSGGMVDLKLVLSQRLEKAQLISGKVSMRLNGIQNEKGTSLDLMDQFKLDDAYEFKYFQIKKYTISLPKGFIPTTLLVELKPKRSNQSKVSETYQWSELLGIQVTEKTPESSTASDQ